MNAHEEVSRLQKHNCFTVLLFGKTYSNSRDLAVNNGANSKKVCLVDCSKNPSTQISINPVFNSGQKFDVKAEGVLLTEKGSAAILRTADCPSLVLYNRVSHKEVITHAGRPALTPKRGEEGKLENIVTYAYEAITNTSKDSDITACITGSICGKCFLHDDENGKKLALPFITHFGNEIMTKNQGLDLPLVIMNQLSKLGIDKDKIYHDGLCTYTNDDLHSYRRGKESKEDRNTIILILR